MRSSWIIQVGLESNDSGLTRPRQMEETANRRRPSDDGGRDWSDTAMSQGSLEPAAAGTGNEGLSLRAFRGSTDLLTPRCQISAPQN